MSETGDTGYEQKKRRSLWLSDMQEIVKVMEAVEAAVGKYTVSDASFTVMRDDDGEDLAEVWWDPESESWLCDWKRESGA